MKLQTDRLTLLSPQEVTAAKACAYYSDNRDFLKAFSPLRDDSFYTEAHQQALLSGQISDWKAGRGYRFYITLKEDSRRIIGSIALSNLVRGAFQSCHLGYQLDGAHAGQGFMTEAVKRIVAFGFEDLHLHRIEGNVIPRNLASRAVLEKCGFVSEGLSKKYLKINGRWEDHIHYVILNEAME